MKVTEEMLAKPKVELSPAEFYCVWKYEQREKGYEGTGRQRLSDDDELWDVFRYGPDRARKSANLLVKEIRAAGLKCSQDRGKKLFEIYNLRLEKENA